VEALSVILLLVGVAGAVLRPWGLPAWAVPVAAVGVDLAVGAASLSATGRAVRALDQPIAFLLAAVPLAVLLDRLGFFAAAADRLTRGRRVAGGLWALAAVVTTVLNLDAGVVLLTPLYVRVARRRQLDPLVLAFQPLILSWLASSALPVSNLTNLIAASSTGAASLDFLSHLALPSLAAVLVGWLCYRRLPAVRGEPALDEPGLRGPALDESAAAGGDGPAPDQPALDDPAVTGPDGRTAADDRRALAIGGVIVALVLVGFVAGRTVGIAEWQVALAADVVLLFIVRQVPWRSVPIGTGLVAASLAALAATVVARLPLTSLLGGTGVAGLARTAGIAAVLANVVNNLPALLVLLPAVGHHPGPSLWALLIGVNMGPVLLATGTLASLLWLHAVGQLGVKARAHDVSLIGLRVGLPGAAAGLVVLLALHAAGLAR